MTQGKNIAIMVIFGHFLTTQKFNIKKLTHFFSKLLSVSIKAIERERQRDTSSINHYSRKVFYGFNVFLRF